MTRQDVFKAYQVNERGIILSPGKFEAEPLYVPYFWDAYLNGLADEDDGDTLTFEVTEEDRKEFPELNNVRKVMLEESDSGFVNCTTI